MLLTRAEIYRYMTVFATRMAAVFIGSTSTTFLRKGVMPGWLAYTGYVVALAYACWSGRRHSNWERVQHDTVRIRDLEFTSTDGQPKHLAKPEKQIGSLRQIECRRCGRN